MDNQIRALEENIEQSPLNKDSYVALLKLLKDSPDLNGMFIIDYLALFHVVYISLQINFKT